MKIPFKPSMLIVRRHNVKWLIIHHTSEIYDIPSAKIDNSKYQLPALYKGVLEKKQGDINYHYVIDKIDEDYIPIVTRPFIYECEWKDIDPNINQKSIHIGLLGNYSLKIPEKRLLEVLAYKLLNPMLKMFHIAPNKIKFHNEVSSNKELDCPGVFIEKEDIITMVRRFIIK